MVNKMNISKKKAPASFSGWYIHLVNKLNNLKASLQRILEIKNEQWTMILA